MSRSYNGRQVMDDDRLSILDKVYSDDWLTFKIYAKRRLSETYDEDDVADTFRFWELQISKGVATRAQVRACVLKILKEGIDKTDIYDEYAMSLFDGYCKENT